MQKAFIIDNNVLRKIAEKGKFALYRKFFDETIRTQVINQFDQFFITPAGILEFLGFPLPKIEIDTQDIIEQAKYLANKKPIPASEIHSIRLKLYNRYYEKLMDENILSKAKLFQKIGEQRARTDPQVQKMIFENIIENARNLDGRKVMYSRLAMDFVYKFDWPESSKTYIYSAFLADLPYALENSIGLGSTRGLSRLWNHFTSENDLRVKRGEILGKLKPDQILQNSQITRDLFKLKRNEDFLDAEAYHIVCAGLSKAGNHIPATFSTSDPFDSIIVRIGIFKSLLNHALSFAKANSNEISKYIQQGNIAVFNTDLVCTHFINVEQVNSLLEIIGDTLIHDWIQMNKDRFLVKSN